MPRTKVAPVAEELDRGEARFPYELVAELGALNLMGIPFPRVRRWRRRLAGLRARGGGARPRGPSVAITLCAHTSLGTQPIYLFGSEDQKREWLPQLCSGEKLGAFGLTEPEAGSDAGNTRTRARCATASG